MMLGLWRTAAVLFTLALVSACGASNAAISGGPRSESMLVLRVRNENPLDARVYVVRESLDYRLGIVASFHTESFRIPALVSPSGGTLRFKVVPVGGGQEYKTEAILIGASQRIDLRLGNPFAQSVVFVR